MYARPHRQPFLVAYDIADHKRLHRVHRFLLGWQVGGQKSFFECWFTAAELAHVVRKLGALIEPAEDRVHVFQLDPRMRTRCYGVARPTPGQAFFLV